MIKECQLETLRNFVSKAFSAGMPQFPHYTLHGKEHLNELDRLCHLVCSSIQKLKNDNEKINLLRLAIIMHDYAMVDVPGPDREQELRALMNPTLSFADIVRKTHQNEIIHSLKKKASELYTIFTDAEPVEFESAIAIASHHRFHPLTEAPNHLKGLCALMRLLDELDIGPARAPRATYSSQRERMEDISKFHWLKHMFTSKIDKGTTFFHIINNDRITLQISIGVLATKSSWQILQQEIVRKLQKCLFEEGVKDILQKEFEVNIEIKAMTEESTLCGIAHVIPPEFREDLEKVIDLLSLKVESKSTHNEVEILQDIVSVNNENAASVQISENQLIIHAIPSENLFTHLGCSGRLSVFGNEYIQRSEINAGGKPGAINRIYLGPADCGKTRSAAEWIHQLTSNQPLNWTILRTDPGNVPENIDDNIILDTSKYGGAHEMPQNAILFLDDLPANLPSTNTGSDDDLPVNLPSTNTRSNSVSAIHRLFTWFKNYPHFHDRRLVGTIRNEDLHTRLDWPEVLPTLGTELELLKFEELSQKDYERLWRGMSRGKIFISYNEGEKNFNLSLSDDFVDQVAQQATNPEGVAKFVFDVVRNNQSQLNKNDAVRFHANATQTWLDNTWPALRNNYGIAARVFHTIARFLEAGLRTKSGFKWNLEPLWEYHAAFGPPLCKKESDEQCNYLEVLNRIGTDGHAIGERGKWIRPRWDYILQVNKLPGVEFILPDASWFASQSRNLSILHRKKIATHLTLAKWDLKDVQDTDAPWLLGIAYGKKELANLEKDFEKKEKLKNEELSIYNEIIARFDIEETPPLRNLVAEALFNKSLILNEQKRSEEAIAVYDDLIKRYGEDQTPTLRKLVASVLLRKGETLIDQKRSEEAIAIYDDFIKRYGEDQMPSICELVAGALIKKSLTLNDQKRSEEAIAVYDDLIKRYGEDQTPTMRIQVAYALSFKSLILNELKRNEEVIAGYDDLIKRYGEDQTPTMRKLVAEGLLSKGETLIEQKRSKEAIAVYDDLIKRYGEDQIPALRELVAKALFNKGLTLNKQKRSKEAIAASDDLINRYGKDQIPSLRELVARALLDKGQILKKLKRNEEAIAGYDDFVRRYGEDQTPTMRKLVAGALAFKVNILREQKRNEEAIAVYDDFVRRYGEDQTPTMRKLVADVLLNKGQILKKLKRNEEAIAVYDDLINRYGEDQTPTMRKLVAGALINKGLTLNRLNRSE